MPDPTLDDLEKEGKNNPGKFSDWVHSKGEYEGLDPCIPFPNPFKNPIKFILVFVIGAMLIILARMWWADRSNPFSKNKK